MNSTITLNIGRFLLLILLQVLVFNAINFLGYINPYPYILFLLLFPLNPNRSLFLFLSFLLGLSVDMFSNSGGVHAASCLMIAFMRPAILRWVFGVSYEFQTLKLGTVSRRELLLYVLVMTAVHHSCLFLLEVFNLNLLIIALKKIVFSAIFTTILSMLILIIFRRK